MVDREDPAASTAMFRAFVQRGETEAARRVGPVVWVVAAVFVVAVVAVLVAVLG